MIHLRVLEILEEQGHSKYWLYNQMGLSCKNFDRLVTNQTISIRYENIEKLCTFLQCTPNELFEVIPETNSLSPNTNY